MPADGQPTSASITCLSGIGLLQTLEQSPRDEIDRGLGRDALPVGQNMHGDEVDFARQSGCDSQTERFGGADRLGDLGL